MTRKYFSPKRSEIKQQRLMAETRGDIKYQGTPCRHGHNGIRYVRNGDCVECCIYKRTERKLKVQEEKCCPHCGGSLAKTKSTEE